MGGPKRPPGETKAEIVRLLKEGLEPPDIAKQLEITTSAVYQHIADLRRLGVLPQRERQAWIA